MRDYYSEEIQQPAIPPASKRDYFTEELIKNKPERTENLLQKMAKGMAGFTGMNSIDTKNPFMSGISSSMQGLKQAPGVGPYMQSHEMKSGVIGEMMPDNPIGSAAVDIATDPETYVGLGFLGKGISKAAGAIGKGVGKASNRFGEIFKSPKVAEGIGKKMAGLESDIAGLEAKGALASTSKKGEKILNQAQESVLGDFESQAKELSTKSRNVFVEHVPKMKENFSKLTKDTYSKYGQILKEGEEEALSKGMDADLYREEVINPVLKTIEQTGAKTPSAEKLKRLFTVKEGIGDAVLEKADDEVLRNFDNLSSIEKMKALRTSLFKPGADDFVQNQYSDLHSRFVGKFSPKVAKANESYGPMKAALRWGSKSIKPFNEQEISRVADILQKNKAGGKGNETIQAYLETLRNGKGEFKGADLAKLSDSHKATLDAIEAEINANKSMIERLKSSHLEDLSTVKKGGYEQASQGRNILQDIAAKKTEKANLKVLQDKVARDVKTRDNLINYGIISGLGAAGLTAVGGVVRVLNK